MTDPIEQLAVWMCGKVYGNTDEARSVFLAEPVGRKLGWIQLARTINEFTSVTSLEHSAKRYVPTLEEIERMSRND